MAATGVDFRSLLSKPVESAEKPKPRPAGSYQGVIEGFKFDTSRQQQTPYVRLSLTSIQPYTNAEGQGNVDLEALAAAGGTAKWKPHKDFYLTEDALYRLREVIESCNINSKGRSFNETIPELKGKPVVFDAVLENSEDKQTGEMKTFTNIGDLKGA